MLAEVEIKLMDMVAAERERYPNGFYKWLFTIRNRRQPPKPDTPLDRGIALVELLPPGPRADVTAVWP